MYVKEWVMWVNIATSGGIGAENVSFPSMSESASLTPEDGAG
jgi:hypothetical protein